MNYTEEQEKIIEENLHIVSYILKGYARNITIGQIDYHDVYSASLEGLMYGAKNYQDSNGVTQATYLTVCMRNRVIDKLRQNKRIKLGSQYTMLSLQADDVYMHNKTSGSTATLTDIITDGVTTEDVVERKHLIDTIVHTIHNHLTELEQQAIKYYFNIENKYVKCYTYDEIAVLMDTSKATARRLVLKGLDKLRIHMKPYKNLA